MSAAVGLFGMALVPFVYWSVNVWRTLHPTTNVARTLPPEMAAPFRLGILSFLVLYLALLLVRVRLERGRAALDDAYVALED